MYQITDESVKIPVFYKGVKIENFWGGGAQTRQIRFSVIFSLKIEYFDKPYIPLESSFQDLSNDVISFYYTSKVIELLINNLFLGGGQGDMSLEILQKIESIIFSNDNFTIDRATSILHISQIGTLFNVHFLCKRLKKRVVCQILEM